MIVQAAIDSGASILYSEDLQTGQTFGPVRVVNPFAEPQLQLNQDVSAYRVRRSARTRAAGRAR